MSQPDFAAALERALVAHVDGYKSIGPLNRLSGGASQETYAFEAETTSGTVPLILRRAPGGSSDRTGTGEGTGALLALPLVQSTARAMHEVATFDSAGVTEK